MQRVTQTIEEIVSKLSQIESQWHDDFSEHIINELKYFKNKYPKITRFGDAIIKEFLEKDFKTYLTIFRLFLELSKDQFEGILRQKLNSGIGISSFKQNPTKLSTRVS